MKLGKSTKFLLNIVLILLIALLVTSSSGISKNLSAQQGFPGQKQEKQPEMSDYEVMIMPAFFETGRQFLGLTKTDMTYYRKQGFVLERVDVEPFAEGGGTAFWYIWRRKP